MTSGLTTSIWRKRNGEQVFASSGSGVRLPRRTAFDHVGDIDFFAFEAHGRDHVVEQLAGATYKRQSLRIFIRAWAFTYKHQSCVGIAVGEDDLVAALVECAAGAVADFFANEIKRGCAVGGANFCGRRGAGVEKACGAEWEWSPVVQWLTKSPQLRDLGHPDPG